MTKPYPIHSIAIMRIDGISKNLRKPNIISGRLFPYTLATCKNLTYFIAVTIFKTFLIHDRQGKARNKKMTIEDTRNYLNNYKALLDKIEYLEAKADGLKSPSFQAIRGYSTRNINDIMDDIGELVRKMEEIEDFIELLDNPRELLAIRYRYIDGMKLEDIAENMSYSVRSVAHFLSKGVKHLTEIANAEGLSLPCGTRAIRK